MDRARAIDARPPRRRRRARAVFPAASPRDRRCAAPRAGPQAAKKSPHDPRTSSSCRAPARHFRPLGSHRSLTSPEYRVAEDAAAEMNALGRLANVLRAKIMRKSRPRACDRGQPVSRRRRRRGASAPWRAPAGPALPTAAAPFARSRDRGATSRAWRERRDRRRRRPLRRPPGRGARRPVRRRPPPRLRRSTSRPGRRRRPCAAGRATTTARAAATTTTRHRDEARRCSPSRQRS